LNLLPLSDRYAADVFELTYREYSAIKPTHYKWRTLAPAAVDTLARGKKELWSPEKLADHLHCEADEAVQRLRRYSMSERVNRGKDGAERISILFREWLDRYEPDEKTRQGLARDLGRLVSSQLHLSAQSGESLEDIALGLEASEAPGAPEGEDGGKPAWGPQWKDGP